MRGKSGLRFGPRRQGRPASMRPAHYAREVLQSLHRRRLGAQASMRPAHYAREVATVDSIFYDASTASMRPAHYAREVRRTGPCRAPFGMLQ